MIWAVIILWPLVVIAFASWLGFRMIAAGLEGVTDDVIRGQKSQIAMNQSLLETQASNIQSVTSLEVRIAKIESFKATSAQPAIGRRIQYPRTWREAQQAIEKAFTGEHNGS